MDEMTELEAYKIAKKRMLVSGDGEQTTVDKHNKKRSV